MTPLPFRQLWWTARGVGWDNVPRRLLQAWRIRSGWLRKQLAEERFTEQAFAASLTSQSTETQRWQDRTHRFFTIPSQYSLATVASDECWRKHVLEICERALQGEYPYFSHWYGQLGWPPNFNHDPLNLVDWPTDLHWLHILNTGPKCDIKIVWEPSRLTLAYYFSRAYAYTQDERWAGAFWQLIEAWIDQNPPQRSAAWGCGQETAFRLMAILTGTFVTLNSSHAHEERLRKVTRLAWQFARRIEPNINYARSQKNNHALSEAIGLWTVGLLFPEFRESVHWQNHGYSVLAAETKRQIYEDGSYVQHSTNYHRVMLDDLLWAMRLGEINNQALPHVVKDRLSLAVRWLDQVMDRQSGRGPNYGSNDGANVLPWSCSDYLDYRPTLQAGWYAAFGERCIESGPWDEKALWLYGEQALTRPVTSVTRDGSFAASRGGYYILRGPRTSAMARCHTYKDRPGQADLLHLDIWCNGCNVIRDAGSFQYNCPEPWRHYFHSTAAHNTIDVDGLDQMIKGPRFLWFRWPRTRVSTDDINKNGDFRRISMQHDGYTRLPGKVVHKRTLIRRGDLYLIDDVLMGKGSHEAALRWRLMPGTCESDSPWNHTVHHQGVAWSIRMMPVQGFGCVLREGENGTHPEGWESLYYGERTSCPTLVVRGRYSARVRLITLMGPAESVLRIGTESSLNSENPEQWVARFSELDE